jgi:hypothetical protein
MVIDEAVREIKRLEDFHDILVLSQAKSKDVDALQRKIRLEITAVKRRAGLIGFNDAGFAEFFRNWKEIYNDHVRTPEDKRAHIRWMQRMLRTPVIPRVGNG